MMWPAAAPEPPDAGGARSSASCSTPIVDDAGGTITALNPSAYTGQVSADMLVAVRLSEMQQPAIELTCIIDGHPVLRLWTEPEQKFAAALQRRVEGYMKTMKP